MNAITNFQTYMPFALRTAKPLPDAEQRLHALVGMVTEVGELADNIKRLAIYGKPFDPVNVVEEVGDFAYYLALYLSVTGSNGKVIDAVVEKVSGHPKELSSGDPFAMLKAVLVLASLVGCLAVTAAEREVSDKALFEPLVAVLLQVLKTTGTKFEDALTTNINKLAARYGDKYSDYNALNRDTAAERAVLEGGNGTPS